LCRPSRTETSPYNRRAHRVRGGIWNEDELPVLEWEAAEFRVVVRQSLQQALGLDTPVLRWSRAKRERVLREHAYLAPLIESPTIELARWVYAGSDLRRSSEGAIAPFLAFSQHGAMWIKMVFGMSRAGSMNSISLYGTIRERDIARWRAQWEHEGMSRREEVDPSPAG
jgi:hypothetical protein